MNPQADNLGIRPLPNLETRFVAANTLIGLNRPGQQLLRNLNIDAKEAELRRVRERHFLARTPATKAKCREQDANLRAAIAALLKSDGWDTTTARELASWGPYDQNASAEFFDVEWMFGDAEGFDVLIGNPPYVRIQTLNYFSLNKAFLSDRKDGRHRGPAGHQFGRNQNIDLMLLPKILVPDIADRAAFALDENGEFAFTSGYGITLQPDVLLSPKYLLALLNSRLLDYCWKRLSTPLRGGFFRYFTQFIEQLPIRPIDFAVASERAQHNAMVALVNRILKAKQANATADTSALEREIDERVYRLYGLTPDEIRLVEESAPSSSRRAEPAPTRLLSRRGRTASGGGTG